jgi:hypothetical protein
MKTPLAATIGHRSRACIGFLMEEIWPVPLGSGQRNARGTLCQNFHGRHHAMAAVLGRRLQARRVPLCNRRAAERMLPGRASCLQRRMKMLESTRAAARLWWRVPSGAAAA